MRRHTGVSDVLRWTPLTTSDRRAVRRIPIDTPIRGGAGQSEEAVDAVVRSVRGIQECHYRW